jgi:hypothetical protein
MMKAWILFSAALMYSGSALSAPAFPTSPDPKLTPGSLCDDPSEYRYPEQVAYCDRSVGGKLKAQVIDNYDEKLGYRVAEMDRKLFKIDHYIPLCMGGSNRPTNLWPQHESVYETTDKLEMVECQKMSDGKLKQTQAIDLMKKAKADRVEAARILQYVQGL